MATIEIDPKYREFGDELVRLSRARDITLSEYAEGLLRLSAEAWFEEPPRMERHELIEQIGMEKLAQSIVRHAFEDQHVKTRIATGTRVNYTDLLVALADSGRDVLRDFLQKGF